MPLFAMPEIFKLFANISPFSWAMKAYYKTILEISSVHKLLLNVLPFVFADCNPSAYCLYRIKKEKFIMTKEKSNLS